MRRLFPVLLLAFLTFGMPRVAEAQVTVAPFLTSNYQFFDGSGSPLNSGCVFTYAASTTTPLVTYSDSAGSTPNSNPVLLNSGGFPQSGGIWLTAAAYKFVVKTTGGSNCSTGSTITTTDGITWSTPLSTFNGITSTGPAVIQPGTAATGGANQSSPTLCIQGFYFNVTSLTDQWCLSNVVGTGPAPTSTFTVAHSGSGGASTVSLPFSVQLNSIQSRTANPATSGFVQLATGDTACWRNVANGANVCLSDPGAAASGTGNLADLLKWNGGGYQGAAFVDTSAIPAASGVLRVGNNIVAVAARNSAGNGDVALIQGDNQNNILIPPPIRQSEIAAPTGILGSDLLWADSTAHRWKMVNNNGSLVAVAATSGDTFTSTTLTAPAVSDPTITGNTNVKRIKANQGTALITGDVGSLTNFGTTASVAAVSGTDSAGIISILSNGTGQVANGSFVLTFHDGTWTTTPVCVGNRAEGNGPNTATVATSTSATTLAFNFDGAAVAGVTYIFNFICVGK